MKVWSSQIKDALAAADGRLRAYCIGRFDFPSGMWGLTDADEPFEWNGIDYAAFGEAFAFALPTVGTLRRPEPAVVNLSATNKDQLTSLFAENYAGRPVELALLLIDPDTDAAVGEVLLWKGPADAASIKYGAQSLTEPGKPSLSTLSLTVSSQGDALGRPGVRTRSDADQRAHRDPLDGFFKNVGIGVKAEIFWGRADPKTPAQAAGGSGGGRGGGQLGGDGLQGRNLF